MGLFSGKNKKELALVFDVGSSVVSGALFEMGQDGTPRIIFSAKEYIPIEDKVSTEKFLAVTTEVLKKVGGKICLAGLGAPRRVFCVLSSPWFASQTRTVVFRQEEAFVFSPKMADELIQKEIAQFEKDHISKYSGDDKVEAIELKNMKTRLNGYETKKPFNQKAKSVELDIFFSVAPVRVLQSFREAINRHFHHETIKFSSFMIASFTVARDVFINQESFILVNIGGEVTDIAMAKEDVLRESISFPLGKNFIVRAVAADTNSKLSDTEAHLSLYHDGHIEEKFSKKFEPAVSSAKNEWLKNFQEFLSKLTSDISIPSTVFVTVDAKLSEFFAETIKNEQFNQYILTESKFRVIFLGGQALHGVALIEGAVALEPSLIIDSIYINRFLR